MHNWDFQALQEVFDFSVALTIATNEVIKPIKPPTKDCLIFTFAKDCKFSIKKAYSLLRAAKPLSIERDLWEWIWRHKGLLSKFKLFI